MKKPVIKENTKQTIINMISDHVIWTRVCESIQNTMNVLSPEQVLQQFKPFTQYVGLDNVFFLLKITEKQDPDYIFRESLISSFMAAYMDFKTQEPGNVALVVYANWKEEIEKFNSKKD